MLRNRKGFTLIELLIVVVIIGILAAIAIPKFAATKDKAKLASLKTDLGNIRTAQEAYFSDANYFAASSGALTGLVNPGAPAWAITGGGSGTSSYTATATNSTISTGANSCSFTYGGTATTDGVIHCP
jgi:prepilin-type N-terminal cleavage/methylation domain-containing protein